MNAITWPVVALAAIIALACPLLFIVCYFWFRRGYEHATSDGDDWAFFAEREAEMRDRP